MLASLQEHTTCVTEHDKYAKGATKPGGYAASGFYRNGEAVKGPDASAPGGLEFLSTRPPWKCTICSVSCTSQETLMGHASGAKHKRRVSTSLLGFSLPAIYHRAEVIPAGRLSGRQALGAVALSRIASWPASMCQTACRELEHIWVCFYDATVLLTQAKAASKQADGPSLSAADSAVTAAPAMAHASEHANDSAQPGLPVLEASRTAESKQDKAEKSAKKKRKADATSAASEPGSSSGAAKGEPKAGKRKKTKVNGELGGLANGHVVGVPQSAGQAAADGSGAPENGIPEPQPKRQKKQKQEAAADVSEAGDTPRTAGPVASKGPSWAKLAKEILAGCEGHSMKLAKLQRKVVAAAGLPKQAVAEHQGAIMQKLSSKRKTFAVTDGEVLLKAD